MCRARELEPVHPGLELPGGLVAQHDGRGFGETPLYLPEQRALVFADGMTAPGGDAAGVGDAVARAARLPAMRALLALPFEHVLVSHGEPVHTRADFEAALEREPWGGETGGARRESRHPWGTPGNRRRPEQPPTPHIDSGEARALAPLRLLSLPTNLTHRFE